MRNSKLSFALLCLLLVAACGRQPAKFNGTDLTGAEWGRDFSLQDPEGRTRTLKDFRGKVVTLFFGYLNCPDVCPTTLARAVEVKKKLGADGARVQVIFVTVDPERDTASLVGQYTRAFDPDFLGLRGSEEQTRQTAKEFKVFYEKAPTGSSYTVNHSAMTYVLDTQGRLRLGLRHTQSADEVAADLRILLNQE